MIILEEKIYKPKEIAEWFEIKPETFSRRKEEKLKELKQYADFELKKGPSGRISAIQIIKVKEPVYGVLDIKKQFLKWLPEGLKEVALWTVDFGYVLTWPLVINYYCKHHNIPYEGPHYILVEDEGRSYDDKRKIEGQRKIPNPKFKQWHSLYNAAKYWGSKNNVSLEDWGIDCCADSFNPTSLRITTQKDLETREQIYQKWFGIKHQEVLDLVDYIEEYDDEYINKDEILQLKLCQRLTDKEKRAAAARDCVKAGVLRRKGFHLNWEEL